MTERDEIRIQEFLHRLKDAMLRLDDLGMEQFTRRIENLSANIGQFSKHTVRSGLVGITSSGKSSLLNVLLGTGKKILKEQSKATTNMIVFCSKSPEPELELNFDNGSQVKKHGQEVMTESIWKYTSEDENPQNKFNVKYIRLSLPTFLLEDGTEIADTPGLDAFGNKEHEDLTLREFLPQADMIIYLSAITSPMKEADRRVLNKIMDADQRIMFVQTCKAAVVEKSLGDGRKETVTELLGKYKGDLEKSLAPFAKLKDAPIVQVETSLAMKYIKDNTDVGAWQDSGMEEFVFVIKSLVSQLQGEYALKNLRKTVDETNALNNLIKNTIGEDANKDANIEQQTKELASLNGFTERMTRNRDALIAKWKERLNPTELYNYYNLELSRIFGYRYNYNPLHDKEFLSRIEEIREKTQNVKSDFLAAIDAAKEAYGESFKELGLDVRRADMQATSMSSFFLPNVQKKRVADATGGGGAAPKFGFFKDTKKETAAAEFIDKDKFIRDLKTSLTMFFEPLSSHLDWWSNTIAYSFIEPLQKKAASLNDDIARIKRGVSVDEAQYNALVSVSNDLEDILAEVSYLYNIDPSQRKAVRFNRYTSKVIEKDAGDSRNLFLQLGSRLFESLFHTYYIDCLGGIATPKTVALIGQDYETQLDFSRRLLRLTRGQVSMLNKMERPFSINIRNPANPANSTNSESTLRNVEIAGEFGGLLSFYILGNDAPSMEFVKSAGIFAQADVIQVMIEDMHRVASALTDLVERNLFFELLLAHKDKLLLTNPSASYFQKDRLHILVTEAIAEIDKVFYNASSASPVKWFIYENFEIRYNYFNSLSNRIIAGGIQPEDCLREWKEAGVPLDEPFSESTLLEQFEELLQNA
ncbi:MAG: dynamin family protein [Nitrospirae bacterium]|nr:dynamin family protein [Nitrospirota bacterium]